MDAEIWISLGAIFLLICLSGFFSGSETALTAVSSAKMTALEKDGNHRAALVNRIHENKDRMIGALLLGNNLVNILATALATNVLIHLFGEAGVGYATIVMTLLVLIFAEVLPKTYALNYADTMAMRISPIIRVLIMVLAPLTQAIGRIVKIVLKLIGVNTGLGNNGGDIEELRGAIEMHASGDNIARETSEQRAMLHSILDLAEVEAEEVMTHRRKVVMIDAGLPFDEIVRQALESPYTRLPLYRETPDNIVGVIHVKWLLREMKKRDGQTTDINLEALASDPWFVPENTSLYDQLQAFRARRELFAIVVNEYGDFMGIITLEDILEEIVGQIDDENDISVAGVRRQTNGSYLINGTVTIRDLNREFDWNLPDKDYSTLAGLILYESQCVPEVGQAFRFHGFRFDIIRRQKNQLTLIRLTPKKEPESENAA